LTLNPGAPAPLQAPTAIGPFNLEASPLEVEDERVDYLFVKRDRLITMLDALDTRDAAALSALESQRNTWTATEVSLRAIRRLSSPRSPRASQNYSTG